MRNIKQYVIALLVCVITIYIVKSTMQGVMSSATLMQNEAKQYVILGANDTGMHCIQSDYASFMLLPPANTVKVQIFEKGKDRSRLVTKGIKVNYEIIDNTTSADKNNFWQYAEDYGYDVAENIGITGNGLKGEMKLSEDKRYFEATAIPVTPYNDNSLEANPYQLAKITVEDVKTGKLLAVTSDIVVPVSNEMKCGVCHGENNTDLNILEAHDRLSGTMLVSELENNQRYKCGSCHASNAIGETGKEGVLPLSQAMHSFHAELISISPIQDPVCYSCHPGPKTQCYRGIMEIEGVSCGGPDCHGDMENVAKTQAEGRQAWLEEPTCQECHGSRYSTNEGKLYRNSYLNNAVVEEMNDKIQCESCHNSPHAQWRSSNAVDNQLPKSVQGKADFISKCSVCHENQKQQRVHK